MTTAVPLRPVRRHRARWWVLALALVGAVGYVAVSLVHGFAAGADALGEAKPVWLAAAAAAEAVAYLLLAAQLRRLVGPDVRLGRRTAIRLAMVLCGFGCVTPASPAEGMLITGADLHRRGLTTRRVGVTLGVAELLSALAIVGLGALDVLGAGLFGDLPSGDGLPLVALALVALIGLGAANLFVQRPATAARLAVALGACCFWRPCPPVETRRAAGMAWHAEATEVVGPVGNRLALLALSAGAWLADVVCCYLALAALGVSLPFDVVFLAYTVGVLATLVPLLPAGLGLVETAVPLVLHGFGAPLGAAVAGVLAYRCVSTLLPAAVGLACIPGLGRSRRSSSRPSSAPAHGPVLAAA
ncbi:MAG TPA: lysylphosphatidylglycerol synthase transmembrane domain-containing protein [Solirubrobacteraceae bacterium]|nr:lysylphosphatidylglycerol synthase transmembrane domain-containing protein [Solirubrobacteraceae bacterium]